MSFSYVFPVYFSPSFRVIDWQRLAQLLAIVNCISFFPDRKNVHNGHLISRKRKIVGCLVFYIHPLVYENGASGG